MAEEICIPYLRAKDARASLRIRRNREQKLGLGAPAPLWIARSHEPTHLKKSGARAAHSRILCHAVDPLRGEGAQQCRSIF